MKYKWGNITFKLSAIFFTVFFYSCNNSPVVPGKVTVNGRVITQSGSTIQGAKVEINGKQTFTSQDGSFSISEVDTPYDLKVSSGSLAIVQKGLFIQNPVVASLVFTSSYASYSGKLAIKYPFRLPAGQKVFVFIPPKDGRYPASMENFIITDSSYSLDLRWNDGPVFEYDLYLVIYRGDTSGVQSYEGFYSKTGLQIQNTATGTINVPLGEIINPDETAYTINVNVPGGYSFQGGDANFIFGNGSYANSYNSPFFSFSTPAVFVVPTGIPILPKVYFSAHAGAGQTWISKTQLVESSSVINMGNNVELLTPPDNQFNVNYNTQFSWSAGEGSGVYELVVYSPSGQLNLTCVTKNNSMTLPDLTSMGISYNSSSDYWWYVRKVNGYNSTDEYSRDPYSLKSTGQLLVYGRKFNFVN